MESFSRRQMADGMEMADMPMGDGIPSLGSFQMNYWAIVGSVIGIATLVNVASYILYRQRYVNMILQ